MNDAIKNYAKSKGVQLQEVSKALGYSCKTSLSRRLRKPLTDAERKNMEDIINEIYKSKA